MFKLELTRAEAFLLNCFLSSFLNVDKVPTELTQDFQILSSVSEKLSQLQLKSFE